MRVGLRLQDGGHRQAARRRAQPDRGPHARGEGARVQGAAVAGDDVPRPLELAEQEPEWVRGRGGEGGAAVSAISASDRSGGEARLLAVAAMDYGKGQEEDKHVGRLP